MENLIVHIDSDGCLADIARHWCDLYNYRYNDTMAIDHFLNYDKLEDFSKPECGTRIYDIIKEPGFFADLTPTEDAVACLDRLNSNPKVDCYVLTDYSGNAEIAHGKIRFYEKYFPFFDTRKIIMCKPKFLVIGNVLIDDKFDNLIDYTDFQSDCGLLNHHTIWISTDQDRFSYGHERNKIDCVASGMKDAVAYIENVLL